MVKLEPVPFNSDHLGCYELAMVSILKYMGLAQVAPLMGTQAYFVLRKVSFSISPWFNWWISEEWKRVHGLTIENLPVSNETDLRDEIIVKLNEGMPVCLLGDTYFLHHTPYYKRIHYYHFVDIFGYDNDRYYVVCPYFRFTDWVDLDIVHTSFFSSLTERKSLVYVPELKIQRLSVQRVRSLAQESCQYMLGWAVPETLIEVERECLGLAGINAFASQLQEQMGNQDEDIPLKVMLLSAQILNVGNSRYWFHELLQAYRPHLILVETMADLQAQFTEIVQSWKVAALMLVKGLFANRLPEMTERAALRLKRLCRQEDQLFNCLWESLGKTASS